MATWARGSGSSSATSSAGCSSSCSSGSSASSASGCGAWSTQPRARGAGTPATGSTAEGSPGRLPWSQPATSLLEVALDVEVDLLEVGEQLGVRLLPEATVRGLVEALDHPVQRPGVRALEEVA